MKPIENLTRPLAIVDSEWTDGGPATARIVSLAIARLEADGSEHRKYWVVNPETPISAASTEVHGIRDEDVVDKPRFREIAGEVEQMLAGADIGGYAVVGDVQIIEREMSIAGRKWTAHDVAIVDALKLWQKRERRRLEDAYRKFVGPVPEDIQAHDADADVDMTVAVIAALQNGKTVAELHEEGNEGMVDVAGKFRLDRGRIVFNFGPYRGCVATEEPQFLDWMLGKDFPHSTQQVARGLLREYDRQQAALAASEAEALPADNSDIPF